MATALALFAGLTRATAASSEDDLRHCQYSRDTAAAIDICTRLIEDAAQTADVRARAYLERAKHYYEKNMGDEDDAQTAARMKLPLDDLGRAMKLAPSNLDLYLERARIYQALERNDEAIADLTTVLNANPKNKWALRNRAEVFELKNDFDRALADLNSLVQLDPSAADPYELRSRFWDRKGDTAKAEADAREFQARKAVADQLAIRADNFSIEPIQTSKSTYYAVRSNVPVQTEPRRDAPTESTLSQGTKVTVTGRTRNSYKGEERWFVVDYADKKPRYVLGEDLLDEASRNEMQAWSDEAKLVPDRLDKAARSRGPLAGFMGAYFAADTCPVSAGAEVGPKAMSSERALAAQNALLTLVQYFVLWSDERFIYVSNLGRHSVDQFGVADSKRVSLQSLGNVTVYTMKNVSPASGENSSLTIAFTSDGRRALFNFRQAGNSFSFTRTSKCDIEGVRDVSRILVQRMLADVHVR
ncbi:hypothetical protein XH88_14390 [Bradyrhizobium sp. CCBAU 51627]|nr:hypothetical protein [Bradyrhizobium sp. CCBAU 51627]